MRLVLSGSNNLVRRMSGDADDFGSAQQNARVRHRDVRLADMDSVGIQGQGQITAIIHNEQSARVG